MRKAIATVVVALCLVGAAGCSNTLDSAGRSAWSVLRPVVYVLDPPSRMMAGTPEVDEEEVAYEEAFIARTRPGVGGGPLDIREPAGG